MRKFSLTCFLFITLGIVTPIVWGQTKQTINARLLLNTTWQIKFKESSTESWEDGETLTFLAGGKLKVSGQTYPQTSWRLSKTKLIFSYSDDNTGMFGSGEVLLKTNQADGSGQLGMRGTPFIIRLVKLN